VSAALSASYPARRAGDDPPATKATDFAIADGEEVLIGTWNIKFFYDHDKTDNNSNLGKEMSAPDEQKWKERVKLTAAAIAQIKPTLLGLQEIENKKVVEELAAELKTSHGLEYTVGFIQGNDPYTEQDVAFLAAKRPGTLTYKRVEDAGLTLTNTNLFKIPSKHLALQLVHTRPDGAALRLTVMVAHLKAGGNPDEPQRVRQSRVLNRWAEKLMTAGAGEGVIVLGDFNAGKKFATTTATDGVGVLRGMETVAVADDMIDLNEYLDVADRRTHVSGRELDRILVSPNLIDDTGLVFKSVANYRHLVVRGTGPDNTPNKPTFYDYAINEADLSDHYPLVAKFKFVP